MPCNGPVGAADGVTTFLSIILSVIFIGKSLENKSVATFLQQVSLSHG
jgi:hypothetical protein